jgi:hypothetical protein
LKKRDDRPRGTGEQRISSVRGRIGPATLEKLARDAESEVAFEIGPAGLQDAAFLSSRDRRGDLQQRGLAGASAGFDQHDTAAAHAGFDRRQLGVAFDEVGHGRMGR